MNAFLLRISHPESSSGRNVIPRHGDYKNGDALMIFSAQTFEFQAVWAARLK